MNKRNNLQELIIKYGLSILQPIKGIDDDCITVMFDVPFEHYKLIHSNHFENSFTFEDRDELFWQCSELTREYRNYCHLTNKKIDDTNYDMMNDIEKIIIDNYLEIVSEGLGVFRVGCEFGNEYEQVMCKEHELYDTCVSMAKQRQDEMKKEKVLVKETDYHKRLDKIESMLQQLLDKE